MSLFTNLRSFVDRVTAPIRFGSVARCDDSSASSGSTLISPLGEDEYIVYHVLGFPECPWFHRASCIAQDLERQEVYSEQIEALTWPIPRDQYGPKLDGLAAVTTTKTTYK